MKTYKPGRPLKCEPPCVPGEYRFRNKRTGKIDYIGETRNLKRRKLEHDRSEKSISSSTHDFEYKLADGRSTSNSRRKHEKSKIEQYNPRYNERSGGAGRPVKRNQTSESKKKRSGLFGFLFRN
jgi:excinuclease UvrABC nuclease subunit